MTAPVAIDVVDFRRRSDRRRFLDVAAPIYRDDPHYVEALRGERLRFLDPAANPGLAELEIHALVARRGGRDVGRVTAHLDRAYDRHHGTRTGWFGFFESIDDPTVAHALLGAAVRWAAARGATELIGPTSFTTNHECGLLVENFARRPMLGTTYNPAYYEDLLTGFGFRKVRDLLGWWVDLTTGFDDASRRRIGSFVERLKARAGIAVRHAEKRRFHEEWPHMYEIYRHAWCDGRLFPFGWLRLAVGLRRVRQARLVLLGVLPGYRKRGLESLLCMETALRARQLGFVGGEASWTLEDNVLINRAIESMGGRRDRTWRLYAMATAASR